MPARRAVVRRRALARTGALAAAAALALAGCTTDDPTAGPTPSRTATPSSAERTPTPSPTPEPQPGAVVATAAGDAVEVFDEPDAATPTATVAAVDAVSLPGQIPLTFLVVEERDGWLRVLLPTPPAGGTGWVRADAVSLTVTDYRVEVRLSEHRLLLHRGEEVVMEVAAGTGPDAPPPGEGYFLTELLEPPRPGGTYGAYAYGLSGHPPVLAQFAADAAVVGIHGSGDPAVVGVDAPAGSVVLADADVARLVDEFGLPLGTPVEVVP